MISQRRNGGASGLKRRGKNRSCAVIRVQLWDGISEGVGIWRRRTNAYKWLAEQQSESILLGEIEGQIHVVVENARAV